jgi:hypothetical protein
MNGPGHKPGVSRAQRLGEEGLARLERQLRQGAAMSPPVRMQWIKRYGDSARILLEKYGQYSVDPES